MPNINSLTYNGTKSTDLGVYVTGSGSFDAAEMDADKYEIAGRNGDLIIPKNRYKNIVVTYPAFIPKAFQGKAQSIRNWMRSAKAYARLEDTYDMEHYRLGLASGIQSFEPVNRNDASNFQLSFDCKPQRFLKTGETPLPIEPETHSYSGEAVSFETVAVDDMTKAEVSLSPIQSLNGYDSPWPGGGGKNKLPLDIVNMKAVNTNGSWSGNAFTQNGITYTVNDDGTVKVNGTASGISQLIFYDELVSCPFNGYILTGCPTGGGNTTFDLRVSDITLGSSSDYGTGVTINLSATGEWRCILFVRSGATINNLVFKPMIRASGTDASFEPYENLCPITGHTGATLKIGAEYPTADREYTSSFGQTVYGGTFDFVSGDGQSKMKSVDLGTFTWEAWAGYPGVFRTALPSDCKPTPNNNTVPNWLASCFRVVKGTDVATNNGTISQLHQMYLLAHNDSCTTAADFKAAVTGQTLCYELATPIEIDLDPTEVQTLLGLNNVWASDGSVEIEYADPFNVDNPTYFEARPLFEITNPAQGDILNVNGKTITFLSSYTGTVTIDCETMNCYSGYANMNYLISATDFPVLNEGLNIVTWSGSGTCTMTPRWWEL